MRQNDASPLADELTAIGPGAVANTTRRGNPLRFATYFVILVCVSIFTLHIYFSWSLRARDIDDAQVSAANLSGALAEHAEATVTSVDAALFGIVQRLEVEGNSPDALARLYPLLASFVEELPSLQGLFVYDSNGKWLVNSMDDAPWMLNNADREYFIFHKTHPDRNAHVGTPVQSRSTGDWVIPVSRRINRPDGSFDGVVLATVPVNYVLNFYSRFNVGKYGAIMLATLDGTLLARLPFMGATPGSDVSQTDIVRYHVSKYPQGVAMITDKQGKVWLYGYKRLTRYPLFVTASRSYEEVLSDWHTQILIQSIGVMILLVLLSWIGRRLVNQIKLRAEAQRELLLAREKLVEMNLKLQKMALEDGLTGVANRRQFDITVVNEFNRARRERQPIALLMMDVDNFKKYNDTYGHPAGDVCLQSIGQLIKTNRAADFSARYGGEEFAVLLPNTDLKGAVVVAENICQEVRNLKIPHSKNSGGIVTISIGVDAFIPDPAGSNVIDLISATDRALYIAKARGRNQVCSTHELPEQPPAISVP